MHATDSAEGTIPSSATASNPLHATTGERRGAHRPRHRRLARDRQGDAYGSPATEPPASRSATPRSDAAAEETADELLTLGAEPVLVPRQRRLLVARARAGRGARAARRARPPPTLRPALDRPFDPRTSTWDWTLNANARALLSLTRVAATSMPSGASIVAISSLGSVRVLEELTLIGASKAALEEALVRYPRGRARAARDPGERRLGGRRETGASTLPNREEMLLRGGEPGRLFVTPDDVGIVSFLCSPDAEMIRGQTVVIDGGSLVPAGCVRACRQIDTSGRARRASGRDRSSRTPAAARRGLGRHGHRGRLAPHAARALRQPRGVPRARGRARPVAHAPRGDRRRAGHRARPARRGRRVAPRARQPGFGSSWPSTTR